MSRNPELLLLPPPRPDTLTTQAHQSVDVVREQRDGLAKRKRELSGLVRQLVAENVSLREQLTRYRGYPTLSEQTDERAEAESLEQRHGIAFHHMPPNIYPDKPYVTQYDLIRAGITSYSRQSMSRLTREDGGISALLIADRVLLPPSAVRALLAREESAVQDASPRRRPGSKRQD